MTSARTVGHKVVGIFIAVVLASAAFVGITTPEASASETTVELSDVQQVGNTGFSLVGSTKTSAKLTVSGGAKIVLNVSAKAIPAKNIKKCWTTKVGKKIRNEVVDPKTGKHFTIDYKVKKGDNTFCTKKGHGRQVFKKSCDNRVWKVPGHKSPKQKIPHVKGSFRIVNYLTWTATQSIDVTKRAQATASVESKDKTCKAVASIEVLARIRVAAQVSFQSRTQVQASASGKGKLIMKAKTSTVVKGQIDLEVKHAFVGKATAMCTSAPPPPPPPPADKAPTISCSLPPHMYHPDGTGLMWCQASDPDGDPITLSQVKVVGDSHVQVSQTVVSPYTDDGNTPCPTAVTCFRSQLWTLAVGTAKVKATVTGGEEPWEGTLQIKTDEF